MLIKETEEIEGKKNTEYILSFIKSVTKKRSEVVFMGTSSSNLNDPNVVWKEYEFYCKPGKIDRRPCLISPYHYRLDWLMWFAAFQVAYKLKIIINNFNRLF